jgi:hypothetical protein
MKLKIFSGPLNEIELEFNKWYDSKKSGLKISIEHLLTQPGGLLVFYKEY